MRKWHKWVGIFLAFFLCMFALSGVFLNHRRALSSLDIPRSVLASDYRYANWNNGAVKNTLKISPDSVFMYGNSGIWLTDVHHRSFIPFSQGIKKGADHRSVNRIVRTPDRNLYAVTTFDLYSLKAGEKEWKRLSHLINTKERFTDLVWHDNTLVLVTRSHVFVAKAPFHSFQQKELPAPQGYQKETSLFRTLWTLHSGEFFGTTGKIIVDCMGVCIVVLCITGVILFFVPSCIKRRKRKGKPSSVDVNVMKKSLQWHYKLGAWFLVFFLLLCSTGMFLRPPLLIAIVRAKVKPFPGSVLNSDNPWFDKLRGMRYDEGAHEWLLYSSDGFYKLKTLDAQPRRLENPPPVSVMGVNVLEQCDSTKWIVGSFSGIYHWDRFTGKSTDFFTGKHYERKRGGMPVFSNAVSGYSGDFEKKEVVFEYRKGATVKEGTGFAPMPEELKNGRMSFWHLCLEIHVGRIYAPLLGFLSDWFVFLSGALFLIVLLSGYCIYTRIFRKKKRKSFFSPPFNDGFGD